jgi:very-short-patch-repair endonuclease
MKRNRIELTCEICGNTFEVKMSASERRCWCSIPCAKVGKRRRRQAEIEQQFGEPIRDLLQRLYHDEQKSVRQIATLLGVSSRNLFEWFYDLQIERRDASTAVALQWADNEQRRQEASQAMKSIIPENAAERRRLSAQANLALQQKRGPSPIEQAMIEALNRAQIAYQFQHIVEDTYLCDFFFPEAKLIVECDSEYWHSQPRQVENDQRKDAELASIGYAILRFTGQQITADIDGCVSKILNHL